MWTKVDKMGGGKTPTTLEFSLYFQRCSTSFLLNFISYEFFYRKTLKMLEFLSEIRYYFKLEM